MWSVHICPLRWYNISYSMFEHTWRCTHKGVSIRWMESFIGFALCYFTLIMSPCRLWRLTWIRRGGIARHFPQELFWEKCWTPYPCLGSRREPVTSSLFCEDVDTCKPDPCIYIKRKHTLQKLNKDFVCQTWMRENLIRNVFPKGSHI